MQLVWKHNLPLLAGQCVVIKLVINMGHAVVAKKCHGECLAGIPPASGIDFGGGLGGIGAAVADEVRLVQNAPTRSSEVIQPRVRAPISSNHWHSTSKSASGRAW